MKRTLAFILMTLISIAGCKKVKDLLRFPVSFSAEFKIPPGGAIGSVFSTFTQVPVSVEETYSNEGTRADLVKEVRVSKVDLTIKNPQGENFRFLKSIKVYISLEDGSEELWLAKKDSIETGIGNFLSLDVNKDAILDKYLRAEKYKLKTECVFRKITTEEITIGSDLSFSVVADPL